MCYRFYLDFSHKIYIPIFMHLMQYLVSSNIGIYTYVCPRLLFKSLNPKVLPCHVFFPLLVMFVECNWNYKIVLFCWYHGVGISVHKVTEQSILRASLTFKLACIMYLLLKSTYWFDLVMYKTDLKLKI